MNKIALDGAVASFTSGVESELVAVRFETAEDAERFKKAVLKVIERKRRENEKAFNDISHGERA